jgi:hypothetical protein
MNRDGFAEILVGASHADIAGREDAGTATMFLGSAAGVRVTRHQVVEGPSMQSYFGHAVASGGDVNGDGFADGIVGAWRATTTGGVRSGAVMVFLGNGLGVVHDPHRVLEGAAAEDGFGWSVAGAQ